MKKFVAGLLIGILLMAGVSYGSQLVAQIVDYKITVNGQMKPLAEKPVTINDRTYLPVRAVAEMFGYDVGFDEQTHTISIATKSTNPVVEGGKLENIKNLSYRTDDKLYKASSLAGSITYDGSTLIANTYTVGEILSIINGVYDIVPTSDVGLDGQISNTKINDYVVHEEDLKLWKIRNPLNNKMYSYKCETIFFSPFASWRSAPLAVDLRVVFAELGIIGSYEVTGDRLVISISK